MSSYLGREIRNRRSFAMGIALIGTAWGVSAGCSSVMGPEIATLFVAPQLVDCVGVGPQKCMQVRRDPNADWEFFYGGIEGFDFEPGFFYELEVEIHQVKDPPADRSSLRYVLRRVVSKIAQETDDATGPEVTGRNHDGRDRMH